MEHKPSGKLKFKLDYVYQTTEQLINITPLSLATPPNQTALTLKGCEKDENGFCDYERFQQVLRESIETVRIVFMQPYEKDLKENSQKLRVDQTDAERTLWQRTNRDQL